MIGFKQIHVLIVLVILSTALSACRPAIDDNAPDPEATSSSTPADGSITTAMLANGAVTPTKLSQEVMDDQSS